MTKRYIFTALLICFTAGIITFTPKLLSAQESGSRISFTGFVKTDAFYDSRNTVNAREGHFALYPAPVVRDEFDNDINKNQQFNMLSIQSRLTGRITGPDAFGAKTSGMLEGAFFGATNDNINTFRLRHAFVKLDWEQTNLDLIVGQYWHPMFVTANFPGVVSFNTGVPFQPFSRNPQVRFTFSPGPVSLLFAAMSQRDFTSPGGSASLRNSGIPNLHTQFQVSLGQHVAGIGLDYKRLDVQPEVLEAVNSRSALAHLRLNAGTGYFKIYGMVGENMTDHLMLGGLASQNDNTFPTNVDPEVYPTKVSSIWGEISSGFVGEEDGIRREVGLFMGYTENRGVDEEDVSVLPGTRGPDIKSVVRFSPRFQIQSGNVRFSAELEYTIAEYGLLQSDLSITETTNAENLRVLLAAYLFF
jgi:hypothetical protein